MNLRYPFLDLGQTNAPFMEEIREAVDRVLASGRYIGGCEVEHFETALAASAGTAYAVGVSNGLDALRLIFRAYIQLGRLRPGDGVIVPANTYVASVLAVTDAGLRPVFVDADGRTMNLDTSLIENALTPDVKAVLTVHLYGRPCYDRALREAVEKHGLILVEDNAQAIGAEAATPSPSGNGRTGGLGHAAAFSFYPTKNVGALGDAGAVTTDDKALADAVRALANYGSDRRYHNIYQGFNCRLDPVQAAVLGVKLRHLDEITAQRREVAAVYDRNIDNEYVVKPLMDSPDRCVWHQYVLQSPRRDGLRRWLEDNGVGTDIHYPVPPHRQPCYSEYSGLNLPVAGRLSATVLSVPVGCVTAGEARSISWIINRFRPKD